MENISLYWHNIQYFPLFESLWVLELSITKLKGLFGKVESEQLPILIGLPQKICIQTNQQRFITKF